MTAVIGQHFIISGRVQGVYFRAFTKQQATNLGLTGWVRNLPEGQVEAKAFGTANQLTAFAEKLRTGPPMAQVATLTIVDIPLELHTSFSVK
ncbi:MAG TPA: acylphosphatase [Gammaproteobacteria bacterium]|nr:acylphosphatase [Gammaproteobacteria bacterium]